MEIDDGHTPTYKSTHVVRQRAAEDREQQRTENSRGPGQQRTENSRGQGQQRAGTAEDREQQRVAVDSRG
jgi:hypothetical protein